MDNWKLGTFYTKNSVYEKVYKDYFEKSTEKHSLKHFVSKTENYHNWLRNVSEKPKAILNQLNLLDEDQFLVFLDADATIEKYPSLFDEIPETYDIGFHLLDWSSWYGYQGNQTELLTGTMFFKNTYKVKQLCEEWYKEAFEACEWEQKVLEKIIKKHSLNIYNLPLEYCYMISRPGDRPPLVELDPVILHHQVSRHLKNRL